MTQERDIKPTAATTPTVIRFRDGEILEGVLSSFDLERPEVCIRLTNPGANAQAAILPLSAIKTIVLSRDRYEPGPHDKGLRKAAVHFWDGDVLRGLLRAEPEHHAHAMILPLISPTLDEIEVFAIPHAAVKGVFLLKAWDSRAPLFERETGRWSVRPEETPLLDLLGEIRVLSSLHVRGEIDRGEFERRRKEVLAKI